MNYVIISSPLASFVIIPFPPRTPPSLSRRCALGLYLVTQAHNPREENIFLLFFHTAGAERAGHQISRVFPIHQHSYTPTRDAFSPLQLLPTMAPPPPPPLLLPSLRRSSIPIYRSRANQDQIATRSYISLVLIHLECLVHLARTTEITTSYYQNTTAAHIFSPLHLLGL